MKFRIFSFAVALIACLPTWVQAVSGSADYTVSQQTFDFGGGHSASGDYANVGSVGAVGSTGGAADYVVRHGFIGQIHDAPMVRIAAADGISRTEGGLRGSVNPNRLESEAWFEFGPAGEFTDVLSLTDLGADTVTEAVSVLVSSLDPGTVYQFRLVASNADGTVQSPVQLFSTEVNLPPSVDPVTLERLRGLSAKILVSELLGGVTDPEGDAVDFDGAATLSANGGRIFVSGGWVLYQPPSGYDGDDNFTYTIRDSFGAETIGTVDVVIRGHGNEPTLNVRSIEQLPETGGHVRIRFAGVPGRVYEIQATEDLGGPWETIYTTTADASGLYEFVDEDAGDYERRFYRAVRE